MSAVQVLTNAWNDSTGCWECIAREDAADCLVVSAADLEKVDLGAADLGCEPGTEFLVQLIGDNDDVLGETTVVAG